MSSTPKVHKSVYYTVRVGSCVVQEFVEDREIIVLMPRKPKAFHVSQQEQAMRVAKMVGGKVQKHTSHTIETEEIEEVEINE